MRSIYEHRGDTFVNDSSSVHRAVSNYNELIPDLEDADPVCVRP